jgi:hypothetical protein
LAEHDALFKVVRCAVRQYYGDDVMNSEIRAAYRAKSNVLGIFPVAAFNGGPHNVAKLYRALNRMGVQLAELRRAGKLPPGSAVVCPCVWREDGSLVQAVSIPRYNSKKMAAT